MIDTLLGLLVVAAALSVVSVFVLHRTGLMVRRDRRYRDVPVIAAAAAVAPDHELDAARRAVPTNPYEPGPTVPSLDARRSRSTSRVDEIGSSPHAHKVIEPGPTLVVGRAAHPLEPPEVSSTRVGQRNAKNPAMAAQRLAEMWLWVENPLTGARNRLLLNLAQFELSAVLPTLFPRETTSTSHLEFTSNGGTWYVRLAPGMNAGWSAPSIAGLPVTSTGLPLLPGVVLVDGAYRIWVESTSTPPSWQQVTTRVKVPSSTPAPETAATCSPYALALVHGATRDAHRMAASLAYSFDPNQPGAAIGACERAAGPTDLAAERLSFVVVGLTMAAGSLDLSAASNTSAVLRVIPPDGPRVVLELSSVDVEAGGGRVVEWSLGLSTLEPSSLIELTLSRRSDTAAFGLVP